MVLLVVEVKGREGSESRMGEQLSNIRGSMSEEIKGRE